MPWGVMLASGELRWGMADSASKRRRQEFQNHWGFRELVQHGFNLAVIFVSETHWSFRQQTSVEHTRSAGRTSDQIDRHRRPHTRVRNQRKYDLEIRPQAAVAITAKLIWNGTTASSSGAK